jgi:hypothetical protein
MAADFAAMSQVCFRTALSVVFQTTTQSTSIVSNDFARTFSTSVKPLGFQPRVV